MELQLIGCSLNAGEKIIIPGFTKLIRQPKNTNTGYLLYSPIDQLDFDREAVKNSSERLAIVACSALSLFEGRMAKITSWK